MKHLFLFLAIVCMLAGCTSPNKANPLIKEYLTETISHPETYKPIKTSVVAKGKIDVASTEYWKHIPANGVIDVVIVRHEFTHDNRSNIVIDNAYYFYMSPNYDVLYYAHRAWDGEPPKYELQ